MRPLAASLCVSLLSSSASALSPRPTPLPAPSVAAEPAPARDLSRFDYSIGVLELIFPDLRFQTPARLSDGVDSLVLSWPVHVVGTTTRERPLYYGASVFVEPALPTNRTAFRGLAGLRAFGTYSLFGAVVEGGGMLASDGSGAFLGVGPAFGAHGLLALVGRRYFVHGEDRWDFTLDISAPFVTLSDIFRIGRWGE